LGGWAFVSCWDPFLVTSFGSLMLYIKGSQLVYCLPCFVCFDKTLKMMNCASQ
jgi:hypothetical protein